jgi:pilus assembly protein CpaC
MVKVKKNIRSNIATAIALAGLSAAAWSGPATERAALDNAVVAQTAAANASPAARPGARATAPSRTSAAAPAAAGPAQMMKGPNCTRGVVASAKPLELPIGKSTLLRIPNPVTYRTVGSPDVVQTVLVPPDGLYLLGISAGSTNMIIQDRSGACHVVDVLVQMDTQALTQSFRVLMPEEKDINVTAAANSVVLSGTVEDATAVSRAVEIANAFMRRTPSFGGGQNVSRLEVNVDAQSAQPALQDQVINQLAVRAPQQVMLEVKVAEVSKTLLDKLGSRVGVSRTRNGGTDSFSLMSSFLSDGGGLIELLRVGRTAITIDGQKDDGLVRVLAEPNLMAISGQQASFLSGGRIFIPVSQTNIASGVPTITLEEKEFGIGVKFKPTVLAGTRISLKLVSEVSDLSQTGSPFTTVGGVTAVLPSLTVRRADTTVQLGDGQSFVIAGLINNNINETIKRCPGLGEIPVLGALFRSTEFQNNQTELVFVVTPRLVKPLAEVPRLPTDNHVVPTRGEVYSNGSLESATPAPPAPTVPTM